MYTYIHLYKNYGGRPGLKNLKIASMSPFRPAQPWFRARNLIKIDRNSIDLGRPTAI